MRTVLNEMPIHNLPSRLRRTSEKSLFQNVRLHQFLWISNIEIALDHFANYDRGFFQFNPSCVQSISPDIGNFVEVVAKEWFHEKGKGITEDNSVALSHGIGREKHPLSVFQLFAHSQNRQI